MEPSSSSSADDVHPQPADRSSSGHTGEEYFCNTPCIRRVPLNLTSGDGGVYNRGKPQGDHLLGVQGRQLTQILENTKECFTYWVFKDVMILRSLRHHTEEEVEGYRLHSRLTIHQVPVNVPLQGLHCAPSR